MFFICRHCGLDPQSAHKSTDRFLRAGPESSSGRRFLFIVIAGSTRNLRIKAQAASRKRVLNQVQYDSVYKNSPIHCALRSRSA
jgi:hypothetical protein